MIYVELVYNVIKEDKKIKKWGTHPHIYNK